MSWKINGLSLTNVRRFSGHQSAKLARVNLLIGENSVGKTTFLGCVNALSRLAGLDGLDDQINQFDQAPLRMGTFNTLARLNCASFRVGLELDGNPWHRFEVEYAKGREGSLKEAALDLHISQSNVRQPDATLRISRQIDNDNEMWIFTGPRFKFLLNQVDASDQQFTTWLSRSVQYGILPFGGEQTLYRKRVRDATDDDVIQFGKFINFFRHQFRSLKQPMNIEAIENCSLSAQRSYVQNPLPGLENPKYVNAISIVGRELGIFDGIELSETNDAFEILVDVAGSSHNISDVGYGITSLLPFLNSFVSAGPETLFLLQQPEVHLHPSAQAALVKVIANSTHSFIVETHSDHIIDWFRILVREGNLNHTDIAIIYFDVASNDKSATHLHQITLDEHANLEGQPSDYREFFSNETSRLLGLGD